MAYNRSMTLEDFIRSVLVDCHFDGYRPDAYGQSTVDGFYLCNELPDSVAQALADNGYRVVKVAPTGDYASSRSGDSYWIEEELTLMPVDQEQLVL